MAVLLAAPSMAFAGESVRIQATVQVLPSHMELTTSGPTAMFPDVLLSGRDVELRATAFPSLTLVDARGNPDTGWNLVWTSGPFESPTGGRIPASALRYSASGGSVEPIGRSQRNPARLPRETGRSGPLAQGLTVLEADPGQGLGTFIYTPAPSNVTITIPAETPAGHYVGYITATMVLGP